MLACGRCCLNSSSCSYATSMSRLSAISGRVRGSLQAHGEHAECRAGDISTLGQHSASADSRCAIFWMSSAGVLQHVRLMTGVVFLSRNQGQHLCAPACKDALPSATAPLAQAALPAAQAAAPLCKRRRPASKAARAAAGARVALRCQWAALCPGSRLRLDHQLKHAHPAAKAALLAAAAAAAAAAGRSWSRATARVHAAPAGSQAQAGRHAGRDAVQGWQLRVQQAGLAALVMVLQDLCARERGRGRAGKVQPGEGKEMAASYRRARQWMRPGWCSRADVGRRLKGRGLDGPVAAGKALTQDWRSGRITARRTSITLTRGVLPSGVVGL